MWVWLMKTDWSVLLWCRQLSLRKQKDENNHHENKTKQNSIKKDEAYQQNSRWVNLHWTLQSRSHIQHSTYKQLHTGLWRWLLLRLTKRCKLSTKSFLFRTIYPHPGFQTSQSMILKGNFPLNVEGNCFWFPSLSDWSRKLSPLSQPITSEKKNQDLVARIFPRFRQFARFYFEFSLAHKSISFLLIGRYDYSLYFGFVALSKSSLTIIISDM